MTEYQDNKKLPKRVAPLTKVPTISPYEWVLISSLRQWTFYSKPRHTASGKIISGNGFDMCIIRIGRRVLIDLDKFDQWIASHNVLIENEGVDHE